MQPEIAPAGELASTGAPLASEGSVRAVIATLYGFGLLIVIVRFVAFALAMFGNKAVALVEPVTVSGCAVVALACELPVVVAFHAPKATPTPRQPTTPM